MNASLDTIYQLYFDTAPFSRIGPTTYSLSPSVGEGTIHRLSTYSGIEIVYSEYRLHSRQTNRFATRERMVELQFAMSGRRSASISGLDFTLESGKGALLLMQDFDVKFDFGCEEPICSFALGIPVELFEYAMSALTRPVNRHFERLTEGAVFKQLDFVPDERGLNLANQLIGELRGTGRSPLLMEAAAYELLNLYFMQLFDPVPVCEGLSREDLRRVRRAAEILEAEMRHPPSLLALAKRVGINDFKLKKGFKAIFQSTVFDYLRQIRMDHAMKLLRSGHCNVTQAGIETGYSNISAFSEQFGKTFGIKPSAVKRIY
ncbi:helix-turn-helix transcriptional regulator [Cohnella sp. LGH]|uniref:helix-turn-helix transcriptional regulator n=1 Tax=Cohnella sp. LGH TaxID=1619153 RepID=UPI001ADA516F|nr:AraC family transcriptional regulator [Cohnella sp. LGH]QTH45696.1 helix-turn-helix transcriptional regulator [Cohnella sp. LGH]